MGRTASTVIGKMGMPDFIKIYLEKNLSILHADVQRAALSTAFTLLEGGQLYRSKADALITPFITLSGYQTESLEALSMYTGYQNNYETRIERIELAKTVLSKCVQDHWKATSAMKQLSEAYFENFQNDDGLQQLIGAWDLQANLFVSQLDGRVTRDHLFETFDEIFARIQYGSYKVELRQKLLSIFRLLSTPVRLHKLLFQDEPLPQNAKAMKLKINFFRIYLRIALGETFGETFGENVKNMIELQKELKSLNHNKQDVLLMDQILGKPDLYECPKNQQDLRDEWQKMVKSLPPVPIFEERNPTNNEEHHANPNVPRWLSRETTWHKYSEESRGDVVAHLHKLQIVVKLNKRIENRNNSSKKEVVLLQNPAEVASVVQNHLVELYREARKVLTPNDDLLLDIAVGHHDAAYHASQGGPKEPGIITELWELALDIWESAKFNGHNPYTIRVLIRRMQIVFRTSKWTLSQQQLSELAKALPFASIFFGGNDELTATALQILGCAQSKYIGKATEASVNLKAAAEILENLVKFENASEIPDEVCNVMKRIVHGYWHGMIHEPKEVKVGIKYAELYLKTVLAKEKTNEIQKAQKLVRRLNDRLEKNTLEQVQNSRIANP